MRRDDGRMMWKEWKDIKEEASETEDVLETCLLEIDPFVIEEKDEEEQQEEDLPGLDHR